MNFKEFTKQYQKVYVEKHPCQVTSNPLVSVCVQTYQHADYIKECLEGILMQKTNFSFEILLGEDASTDGTREICIEYAHKYPDKIRLFLHHRANNIAINGSPTGRFSFIYNIGNSNGSYIAFCDGDDYWTDPYKLQGQVNFLEKNKTYSLCFHRSIQLNNGTINEFDDLFFNRDRNSEEILWGGILLNTVLYRNHPSLFGNMSSNFFKVKMVDVYILITLSKLGSAKYINVIKPSVYRHHSGGIWSPMSIIKRIESRIANYILFDNVSGTYLDLKKFIIMNFYLDLVIANVKESHIYPAFIAYWNAFLYSFKSLKNLKWFVLAHVLIRYKKVVTKKIKEKT